MEIMTPNHPKWDEFVTRLEGPEGCNFREDPEHGIVFNCGGGKDKSKAAAILRRMGFESPAVAESLEYFEEHGGYCDCEILFNVEPQKNETRE
jgi:rhodanese-related sulfurtransferase